MSSHEKDDQTIPTNTDAYYEKAASQEEIYDEETVEEVREVLTSDDPSSSQRGTPVPLGGQCSDSRMSGNRRK